MGNSLVLLPEVILVASGLALALLGFWTRKRPQVLWIVALVTLGASMVLTLDMMGLGLTTALGFRFWTVPIGNDGDLSVAWKLKVDTFALLFQFVFEFVAFLAILASRSYIRPEEPHQGEYYALIFIAVAGMMLTAAATDLFVLYLAFELSSISTFALVAFRKRDRQATEASLKFFVIGAVSSALILFGISLIYGVSGNLAGGATTDLLALRQQIAFPQAAGLERPLVIGIVFLIAGFGFKVAVVPFHMWAPDVYQGSPTTISVLLAAGSKKVGIVALFKVFLLGLLSIQIDWILAIAVLAIVTQTVGNVLAIPQRNVKRMLAYSSIAQVGYILTAVVVGALALVPASDPNASTAHTAAITGVQGGLFHVLTHAIMKGGAFLVVAATAIVGIGEEIEDYRGLGRRMPFVAFSMVIFLLSLAGIPPLGGFLSKFVLFSSAVIPASINPWFLALAISGVLNSALSLYYYARVIWYMWVLEPSDATLRPAPRAVAAAIGVSFVLIFVTGLGPALILPYLEGAARVFLGI